jgi:TatA/E family protein of Tat protein translocase
VGQFSLTHLILLAAILLIFFGPSRLPQLGQSLGKAIRGFKQGLNELDAEVTEVPDEQLTHEKQNTARQTNKEKDQKKS